MPSNSSKKFDFKINGNGCFICTTHKAKSTHKGHTSGRVRRNGKTIPMHRWIYQEMFGEIPEGHVIRHKCDNPLCINPEHLETGTPKQNSQDMIERGRSIKGEKNPMSKLTENEVIEIKSLFGKMKQTEIAKKFNVSTQTICDIKKKRMWGHVK